MVERPFPGVPGLRVEQDSIFELKMGVGSENLEFRMEKFGVILVFGLKTGLLGGAIGHLVFRTSGDIGG